MINIKATNMELTPAITDYVNKRLSSLEKFAKGKVMTGQVEVGKTTNHHKQGEVYKAEFDINIGGERFFTEASTSDLYASVDEAKEEIARKITNNKDRKNTLYKRGAKSVKKMLKGISKRNPFTSKY